MPRTYTPKTVERRTCAACGAVFRAKRDDARLCGVACRQRASRHGVAPRRAFQASMKVSGVIICDGVGPSLCSVREVSRDVAIPVIEAHEWLGTSGNANRFFALYEPSGQIAAVVGLTTGMHNAGAGAVVLARGCTLPGAHRNAASALIGAALRAMRAEGHRMAVAYSDPMAGERGVIYRAAGFLPVTTKHGGFRTRVRPPGVAFSDHGSCYSDRWLRHGGRNWSVAEARLRRFKVERVPVRQRWERPL